MTTYPYSESINNKSSAGSRIHRERRERGLERIFDDEEFEAVGATLVAEGSWVNPPKDHIIVGLKELPADECG